MDIIRRRLNSGSHHPPQKPDLARPGTPSPGDLPGTPLLGDPPPSSAVPNAPEPVNPQV